jgi:predicted membrane protein (TIGR00267 family)
MAGSSSRGDYAFALVIGLVDGILTALILAAGKVVAARESIHLSDLLRVAVVASISAAFTFFVAQYSRFRHELVHAERHLTLGSRGPLVKTRLGHAVFIESIVGSVISGTCSFIGAVLPLLLR